MEVVYRSGWRDDQDTYDFYYTEHLAQQDHDRLPDHGILKCRNMYENVKYQYIEGLLHLLVFSFTTGVYY
jgi:hypothetical protein